MIIKSKYSASVGVILLIDKCIVLWIWSSACFFLFYPSRIPKCSHWVQQDCPELTNQYMREFLETSDSEDWTPLFAWQDQKALPLIANKQLLSIIIVLIDISHSILSN